MSQPPLVMEFSPLGFEQLRVSWLWLRYNRRFCIKDLWPVGRPRRQKGNSSWLVDFGASGNRDTPIHALAAPANTYLTQCRYPLGVVEVVLTWAMDVSVCYSFATGEKKPAHVSDEVHYWLKLQSFSHCLTTDNWALLTNRPACKTRNRFQMIETSFMRFGGNHKINADVNAKVNEIKCIYHCRHNSVLPSS